jgi:hypothetical protein
LVDGRQAPLPRSYAACLSTCGHAHLTVAVRTLWCSTYASANTACRALTDGGNRRAKFPRALLAAFSLTPAFVDCLSGGFRCPCSICDRPKPPRAAPTMPLGSSGNPLPLRRRGAGPRPEGRWRDGCADQTGPRVCVPSAAVHQGPPDAQGAHAVRPPGLRGPATPRVGRESQRAQCLTHPHAHMRKTHAHPCALKTHLCKAREGAHTQRARRAHSLHQHLSNCGKICPVLFRCLLFR